MKRVLVTVITVLLFVLLMFNACGRQNNNTIEESTTYRSNLSETDSQNFFTKEFKKYLGSKKTEILKAIGNDIEIETGTISVIESHMVFPIMFVKALGLTFVFPNEIDDLNPTYIYINKETNVKNVNIKGAKPGMKFEKIMNKLGSTKVEGTWISSEDNIAYKIEYIFEGVVYTFVSYDTKGTDSQLIVYLRE